MDERRSSLSPCCMEERMNPFTNAAVPGPADDPMDLVLSLQTYAVGVTDPPSPVNTGYCPGTITCRDTNYCPDTAYCVNTNLCIPVSSTGSGTA